MYGLGPHHCIPMKTVWTPSQVCWKSTEVQNRREGGYNYTWSPSLCIPQGIQHRHNILTPHTSSHSHTRFRGGPSLLHLCDIWALSELATCASVRHDSSTEHREFVAHQSMFSSCPVQGVWCSPRSPVWEPGKIQIMSLAAALFRPDSSWSKAFQFVYLCCRRLTSFSSLSISPERSRLNSEGPYKDFQMSESTYASRELLWQSAYIKLKFSSLNRNCASTKTSSGNCRRSLSGATIPA